MERKHGRAPLSSCLSWGWGASRSAFTLVEMIVVVAIVLLLSAMLFPVLETAMGKGEAASCISNMRSLGMASRLYCDDYDDRLVPALLPDPVNRRVCWDVTLSAYTGNDGLLLCPTDECPRRLPGALCAPHSYGINLELAQVGGYMASSMKLGEINDPVMTILFCELAGERCATHGVNHEDTGLERVATNRHGNGSHYTFVDGHTKWLRPEATEQPDLLWDP